MEAEHREEAASSARRSALPALRPTSLSHSRRLPSRAVFGAAPGASCTPSLRKPSPTVPREAAGSFRVHQSLLQNSRGVERFVPAAQSLRAAHLVRHSASRSGVAPVAIVALKPISSCLV